jgi:hypothetical protein
MMPTLFPAITARLPLQRGLSQLDKLIAVFIAVAIAFITVAIFTRISFTRRLMYGAHLPAPFPHKAGA